MDNNTLAHLNAMLLGIGLISYIAIRILQKKDNIALISGGGEIILLFVCSVLFIISDFPSTKKPEFFVLVLLCLLIFMAYSVYSISKNNFIPSDKKLLYILLCIFAKYFMVCAGAILLFFIVFVFLL
jgi:CHASE2 domain-containing sensor protein